MKKILVFSFFVLLSYTWLACEEPPIYDDTPHITWKSFSKDTIAQFYDGVAFTFEFTDGDGDLGKDNDTSNHIIIVDTRRTPNDTLFYKIPTIEQQGIVSGIKGEIEVTMSQICCMDPNIQTILCPSNRPSDEYQPIVYTIKIKDNAGRWSNAIQTDTLYVHCSPL